jgi:hypothetical protein
VDGLIAWYRKQADQLEAKAEAVVARVMAARAAAAKLRKDET